ncbi:hypothetical protein NLU13_9433 [Sarocladium strictum]|uniref:Major facilitator superfamily (MFS) profile domain-containing protein n=1 Tax=Sarocladium strictum TaxID=5046 RepID=A0AA39L469_SARSR|nr:hypothetical protein NLU13_9433 [Sarocladium strictum]
MTQPQFDDASEAAHLLHVNEQHPEQPISHRGVRLNPSRWQAGSPGTVVLLVATAKFAVVASGMMILMPIYRLIEDALCHTYYQDNSLDIIDEMKCKVDHVQTRLSTLMGWITLINNLMTLFVAFPYGILADKIGRKPTVLLSYGGMAVSFMFAPLLLGTCRDYVREHPYVLMTGAVFQLVGGGVPVLLSTLYAIVADVSDEKDKAANFLYLTFGATLGGLCGPLLAGLLMARYGPWMPIWLVIFITPVVVAILLAIPETLSIARMEDDPAEEPTKQTLEAHIKRGLADLKESLSMLKNINIPLILITFLSQNARFTAYTGTLGQYISKHFGWKLAETSILLSPLGVLNLLVLAILPKISQYLLSPRVGLSTFRKDLLLTRISTLLLICGAVIEGFSHNIVLFLIGLFIGTFGAADSPLARATISHYVPVEFTSRLYALIGIAEVLGAFIGGPVLAFFFNKGLAWKGFWIGLPWFYIAFTCIICWVALLWVRPPKAVPPPATYQDSDEEGARGEEDD